MKLDQFTIPNQNQYQAADYCQHFTLKQIAQARPQQLLDILLQKDRTIQTFSQQITRFKAEQLKTKKLVASLQQKIQKTLPSATNTSTPFIIASQFKTLFTAFMTTTVPSLLYDFTDTPKIYSLLLKTILSQTYSQIQAILNNKTESIRKILLPNSLHQNYQNNQNQNSLRDQSLRGQIRYHLLSLLQKYFRQVFPTQLNSTQTDKSSDTIEVLFRLHIPIQSQLTEEIRQKIGTLNSEQIQKSDQAKQFCIQLYQICIYMLLQQNPWQFVFETQANMIYTKKQFTCIDGFAKQGNSVQMVLKGLKRKANTQKEFHYHPNIKNFVLPNNQDEQESPQSLEFKVDIIFLSQASYNRQIPIEIVLQDITESHQDLYQPKLNNPPSLAKKLLAPKNIQNQLQNQKCKITTEESFKIEALSQTQKSDLIQSLLVDKQNALIENDSNYILDLTQSYTLQKKLTLKEHDSSELDNKQNVNENLNFTRPEKKISTNSKKERLHAEKNIMKKHKKDQNNSTIDLTSVKHKANNKENKENAENENHKKKIDEFPFAREVLKSSKKKGVGKSSRKCSVGKIVSQSAQMTGSSVHIKQKISLSHHNTMVMKQVGGAKISKDMHFQQGSYRANVQNKQNMGNFVGHMYQKQIIRPKKSTKLSNKLQEKPSICCTNQAQKQQRPLALRAYQNNCLVGKLREKYLIG